MFLKRSTKDKIKAVAIVFTVVFFVLGAVSFAKGGAFKFIADWLWPF